MQFILVIGMIVGVAFLGIGTFQTIVHSKSPVEQRLTQINKRKPIEREIERRAMEGKSLAEREEMRNAPRRADLLPLLTRYLNRHAFTARLEQDLRQARSQWRASELMWAASAVGLISFIIIVLLTKMIIVAFLFGLGALWMPFAYVRFLKGRWQIRFQNQLADTLTLMSNALKSGYSFMQAVEMVSREAEPPMCDEFRRINEEISIGKPVEEALDAFSQRIGTVDVELVVMAVLIQREVGGALAEILDIIAATIRERVKIRGEIRTLTTQGRMSGFFLALMPLGLGFAVNVVTKLLNPGGPSYMEPLLITKTGHIMIIVGFVMQLIGFLVIRKIVSIEV